MDQLEKVYSPKEVEARWGRYWEENQLFHGDETSAQEPFSIVIPPPNITGSLHIGHAFNNTLQDILTRRKRMLVNRRQPLYPSQRALTPQPTPLLPEGLQPCQWQKQYVVITIPGSKH